jgi:uncharacterized protein (DUF1501 family)
MSGFDTHANQVGQQENLLARFADGMKAFQKDMKAQGNENRVLVMGFSEFGRRVAENGSAGTDHGTAGPMFLFGPGAQPGLLGRAPSLTDLDQGDLRHTTDFRRVYASVLEGWLGQSSQSVLGSGFATLPILRTGPNKISG